MVEWRWEVADWERLEVRVPLIFLLCVLALCEMHCVCCYMRFYWVCVS